MLFKIFKMASQREFVFRTWGGKRAGAGRKSKRPRPGVPHLTRPGHRAYHPVHITLRARAGLPPFRERAILGEVQRAIARANRVSPLSGAFRVIEFSVQNDHVHFVAEAHDRVALSRGMQGLAIRLARAVNRALSSRGQVWDDRYHARDLKTPREVRNAIVYVLMNAKKHGFRVATGVDAFSSAPWFAGFSPRATLTPPPTAAPVAAPRTWLAAIGWRKRGLIRLDERPSG